MNLNLAIKVLRLLKFDFMKKKILVTGGAGYIGNVLTRLLVDNNYNVTVLDNLFFDQPNTIQNLDINFIKGDIRDEKIINKDFLKYFDYLIPLAALVGAPLCEKHKKEAEEINLNSTYKILKACSKNIKIILPNTNSGYGISSPNEICDENYKLNPISTYGKTKVKAEEVYLSHNNTISFRLATVFGYSPRMRLDLLVNHFVNIALTTKKIEIFEGHFKRNYVHIFDVARAFLFAIENFEKMRNNIFNLGLDDLNLSKNELSQKIKQYIPDFEITQNEFDKDPDQRNYIVSNKKIKKFGFEFKKNIDDGIKELIKEIPKLNKGLKYSNI